jgi:MoxR-like ATPase
MQHQTENSSTRLDQLAADVGQLRQRTNQEVSRIVVGLKEVTDLLLVALVAGGHVLMEGVPGTAKTTLCKTFAHLLGVEFQRIQFTPDLLPGDVTGTYIFDRARNEFVLRKGPVFCQMLLADELNRAPAKTQSALLEAMQESQVTIEGTTLALPRPFLVLATQNPIEQEGVYRLPEAQLDRFLIRVEVGYPGRMEEIEMLDIHAAPVDEARAITDAETILAVQSSLPGVHVSTEIRGYVVDLARRSREHPDVALGASPRAALYLMHAARARAILDGRAYVTHEDVQQMVQAVFGHRLILRPEAEVEGRCVRDVIDEVTAHVPVTTQADVNVEQP